MDQAPSPRRTEVVVVGSLHLDVLVRAVGRPVTGETLPGDAWWLSPGGKGGNQAVEAARFGAAVSFVGRVGDDEFGCRLRTHLHESGVQPAALTVDPDEKSGMSVAIVDPSGDYGAVIVSGANARLGAGDLDQAEPALARAAWVILQNEIPPETNLRAARRARVHGVRVLWNAAPARSLDAEIFPLIDVLVVNAVEAEQLTAVAVRELADAERAASRLLDRGFASVIVTAGGAGSVWSAGGQPPQRFTARPVEVVNTHGAGDAYIGALTACLAAGEPMPEAIAFAGAAATLLVGTAPERRAQIRRAEVEAWSRGR